MALQRPLLRFADESEFVANALHDSRDKLSRSATRIRAVISELFALSSIMRQIDNLDNNLSASSSFHRVQDDLNLLSPILRRTLDSIFNMFAQLTERSFQILWEDLCYAMEREEGFGLLERIELFRGFLSSQLEILHGHNASDLADLRRVLASLGDAQKVAELPPGAPKPSPGSIGPTGSAVPGSSSKSVFNERNNNAANLEAKSPEEMQKRDPLDTQIWKLYHNQKGQLPNSKRLENLTWRKRKELGRQGLLARQKGQNAPSGIAQPYSSSQTSSPKSADILRTSPKPKLELSDTERADDSGEETTLQVYEFASKFLSELSRNCESTMREWCTLDIWERLLRQYSALLRARAEHSSLHQACTAIDRLCDMIAMNSRSFKDPIIRKVYFVNLQESLSQDLLDSEGKPTLSESHSYNKHSEDLLDVEDLPAAPNLFEQTKWFLFGGIESKWLIHRMKVASITTSHGEDFDAIRDTLILAATRRNQVTLSIDWNPRAFFEEQYGPVSIPPLSEMICIVGDGDVAEATTCQDYIARTWPMFGRESLVMLDNAFAEGRPVGMISCAINGDHGVKMNVQFLPSTTLFDIDAPRLAYAVELGEVICWLAAACQAPGLPNETLRCSPRTRYTDNMVKITLRFSDMRSHAGSPSRPFSDDCWLRIFNNAVITNGYPTQRRDPEEKGLRISIEMMAILTCAYWATLFDGVLMLKGLCSMFVPVFATQSSIVWHYILNDDLEWMSHNRAREDCSVIASLDFATLASKTHFVGWTRDSSSIIGTTTACYDTVDYSGSSLVKAGFALDGITVGFSKLIEMSTKITPGKKDTRILFSSGGPYPRVVSTAASMDVVFYDVQAKRGWLVDGASALLYLSRASLTSPQAPELDSSLASAPSNHFAHLDCPASGHRSAKDVLLNMQNRKLVLYENENTPWRFEDLVLRLWELLSEIKSQSAKLRSSNTTGWNIRRSRPARLEGFEFADLLSNHSSIAARVTRLEPAGTQWARVMAESETINILGSSFGVLLKPGQFMCKHSLDLPCGASLLAAPLSRLHSIARKYGEIDNDYWKLAAGLYWNEPYNSFGSVPCGCQPGNSRGTCGHLITELQSHKAHRSRDQRHANYEVFERHPQGAIIIGTMPALRNISLPSPGASLSPNTHSVNSNASDSGIDLVNPASPSLSTSSG